MRMRINWMSHTMSNSLIWIKVIWAGSGILGECGVRGYLPKWQNMGFLNLIILIQIKTTNLDQRDQAVFAI